MLGCPTASDSTQAASKQDIFSAPVVSTTYEDGKVTLSWKKIAHADYYELMWNGGAVEKIDKSKVSITKTGLTNGKHYSYILKACRNTGAIREAALTGLVKMPIRYAVQFCVNGGHGAVTASVDGKPISSGDKIEKDKTVTFTAAPDTDYEVDYWTATEKTGENTAQVTVKGEVTVVVAFKSKTAAGTTEFPVTFSVEGGHGSLTTIKKGTTDSVTSGNTVEKGATVIFTATPHTGYAVDRWTVDGNPAAGSDLTFTKKITAPVTVKVSFKLQTYPVEFDVNGGEGSVIAALEGSKIESGKKVVHGKIVTFTATPKEGYKIERWTVNGTAAGNANEITQSITADTNIHVSFKKKTYAVQFNVNGGHGTITAKAGTTNLENGNTVEHDTVVTFTAQPNDGYEVDYWTAADKTGENTAQVTVKGAVTVAVVFKLKAAAATTEFPVTFSVEGGNGTLTAKKQDSSGTLSSGNTVEKGATVIFTAIPHTDYEIERWTVDGNPVTETGATLTRSISAPVTVTVRFKKKSYPVNFRIENGNEHGSVTAKVDGKTILTGAQVEKGKTVTFTAAPTEGYEIERWTVNGTSAGTGNEITQPITAAADIRVAFKKKTYTVAFSVTGGHGKIEAAAEGNSFQTGKKIEHSSTVSFTAKPEEGYEVLEWRVNGTAAGNASEITLPATAPINIQVSFKIKTYTIAFSVNGGHGTITAKDGSTALSSGTTVEHGKTLTFTATPDTGYEIAQWTVNGIAAGSGNEITQPITANTNIHVSFKKILYTVHFETNGSSHLPSIQVPYGEKIPSQPVLKKELCEFKGWYTTPSFTTKWDLTADTVVKNMTLYAKWEPQKITIEFDDEKIVCLSGKAALSSGMLISDMNLLFAKKDTADGKVVSRWLINGKPITVTKKFNEYFQNYEADAYTITKKDIKNTGGAKTLTLTYEERNADEIVIHVEDTVILHTFPAGKAAPENTLLIFEIKDKSKTIIEWTINGKPITTGRAMGLWYYYTVHTADAITSGSRKVITIGLKQRDAQHCTFNYDKSKIQWYTKQNKFVAPGSSLLEGTLLSAKAPTGQKIKQWKVNGIPRSSDIPGKLYYCVSSTDTDSSGVITMEVECESAQKLKLQFDTEKIACNNKDKHEMVSNNEEIYETTRLRFELSPPISGKKIKRWKINGIPRLADDRGRLYYTVNTADADSANVIKVEAILETAAPLTIKFDPPITCWQKWKGDISPNTTVYEGNRLKFKANPPTGKKVTGWKINGTEQYLDSGDWPQRFYYDVKEADAESGIIKVEAVFETAAPLTVQFDAPITCQDVSGSGPWQTVNSGDTVYEGMRLSFEANPSSGKNATGWTVNGIVQHGNSGDWPERFSYKVKEDDAKSGVIKVEAVLE